MSAKHTPGPWEICEHSWSDTSIYCGFRKIASLSIYDQATEETQQKLEREMDANARLIAAAPDLLSAAQKALDDCVDLAETPAGNLLKAAIAKATGKEHA